MKLHEIEVISRHKDVAFVRIRVNGGHIYTTKNSLAMTSCFVPDTIGLSLDDAIKKAFDKLPSFKAGERVE